MIVLGTLVVVIIICQEIKKKFLDLDTTITPKVQLENGAVVDSKRMGRVTVATKKGN